MWHPTLLCSINMQRQSYFCLDFKCKAQGKPDVFCSLCSPFTINQPDEGGNVERESVMQGRRTQVTSVPRIFYIFDIFYIISSKLSLPWQVWGKGFLHCSRTQPHTVPWETRAQSHCRNNLKSNPENGVGHSRQTTANLGWGNIHSV